MRDGDAIREQLAELVVGPAAEDELGDEVQLGPGVEIVRDAGRDDYEGGGGAGAALVVTDEEPVLLAENQSTKLTIELYEMVGTHIVRGET
jgi:hypothetical protein